MRKRWMAAMVAAVVSCGNAMAVDLEAYVRQEMFGDIILSPDGEYLAATVPGEDYTGLVILRTADHKMVSTTRPPRNNHVSDVRWVSDSRVVFGLAEKFGQRDQPSLTGELMAMNADGGRAELLVGYRVQGRGPGTRIQPKKVEAVAAFLTDDLPDDDRNVIIAVSPFTEDPFTRAERMDTQTGKRVVIALSPVRRAHFTTDAKGEVRFAHGAGADNVKKLYYRSASSAQWVLVNDEAVSGRIESALGFTEDGRLAILRSEQKQGPDTLISWDPVTGERKLLAQDPVVDPNRIIYRAGTSIPVGALYLGDVPRTRFFDET